uniref:Large ribosomal subunit protein uL2c n=1 Tax=Psilotum nudum TaxID=3240 RepID=RK2_PSINU|nr:ribosomal protein L2 [Psilotum nudum]Q8WHY1.1 RecName: Full=Large ribosomal subunit protein uL2c; AltName: Full=50S ribosomal protein L2, chloroplastic [Psilotum nudum]BAB84258.1 ribosomal protein L2 [Psilotum nudum]
MAIRSYRAYTPGTRHRSVSTFEEISKYKPKKRLTLNKHSKKGRNNRGIITSRHRGGGHKRIYREIDFRRNNNDAPGKIATIEYDPNRNSYICIVNYENGDKRYILHPKGLNVGDLIFSGTEAPISNGNTIPLTKIPVGTFIHNIELTPGKGGQLVRAAGTVAKIMAKEEKWATIRLPSGEFRLISKNCLATIGQVGNIDANKITLGKAGSKRWLGKRPIVRGVAMNSVDHPHGGGEGKTSIGRKKPLTPWGRTALGSKSRPMTKYSNIFILRRRKKR